MVFIPSEGRPGPSTVAPPPGVTITNQPGKTTTVDSKDSSKPASKPTRYDNTIPVAYQPPINYYSTADNMERQIAQLPAIYRATTVGDMWNAYNSDPVSRTLIDAAARAHYGNAANYSSFNESWISGYFGDVVNAATANGSQPAWMILQNQITSSGSTTTSSPGDNGSYSGGGGYGGGGGGQVSLTNPTSARGLLMQTMQSVLGRNPSESEYSTFLKSLNEAQMENPMTVDTSGDTLVQSGGVDPSVLALEFAQGAEDYKSREASKYYNMFMAALGGASGG